VQPKPPQQSASPSHAAAASPHGSQLPPVQEVPLQQSPLLRQPSPVPWQTPQPPGRHRSPAQQSSSARQASRLAPQPSGKRQPLPNWVSRQTKPAQHGRSAPQSAEWLARSAHTPPSLPRSRQQSNSEAHAPPAPAHGKQTGSPFPSPRQRNPSPQSAANPHASPSPAHNEVTHEWAALHSSAPQQWPSSTQKPPVAAHGGPHAPSTHTSPLQQVRSSMQSSPDAEHEHWVPSQQAWLLQVRRPQQGSESLQVSPKARTRRPDKVRSGTPGDRSTALPRSTNRRRRHTFAPARCRGQARGPPYRPRRRSPPTRTGASQRSRSIWSMRRTVVRPRCLRLPRRGGHRLHASDSPSPSLGPLALSSSWKPEVFRLGEGVGVNAQVG
jgi:hypothetical protein